MKLLRASFAALLWAPLYGTAGGQVHGDWAVKNVGTQLSEALS